MKLHKIYHNLLTARNQADPLTLIKTQNLLAQSCSGLAKRNKRQNPAAVITTRGAISVDKQTPQKLAIRQKAAIKHNSVAQKIATEIADETLQESREVMRGYIIVADGWAVVHNPSLFHTVLVAFSHLSH